MMITTGALKVSKISFVGGDLRPEISIEIARFWSEGGRRRRDGDVRRCCMLWSFRQKYGSNPSLHHAQRARHRRSLLSIWESFEFVRVAGDVTRRRWFTSGSLVKIHASK